MCGTPIAPVKDLLSTGYFYEELKNHVKSFASKEMDLISFNRDFAVPYLIKKLESYKGTGQTNRARILNLAVKFLSNVNDAELTKTIFALKKVAEVEEDVSEREIYTTDQPERAQSFRQRSESAKSLNKLLTSIIKMFRLEQFAKKDNSEEENGTVEDSIKRYWEMSMLPAV